VLACRLHRDLRTWSRCWVRPVPMCIVSFLAFVRYQQNHRQKAFNWETLRFCRGGWHSKIWQKIHWYILFHISHWEAWIFVWGALSPPKPRGDWTGYHQTSISKTVLPKHVRWDIGILDAQQWLLRLTFDGNYVEQLYSAQPLPSCTTISITLFNKSLNHNHIQATFLSFSCWDDFFYDCKC